MDNQHSMNIEKLKKIFSLTNLYYAGTTAMLIIMAILLSSVYSAQIASNAQANLLLSDADGILSEIKDQQKTLEQLSTAYYKSLPTSFQTYAAPFTTNDLTRYFDDLELKFRENGTMVINSIGYVPIVENPGSYNTSLSVRISQQNLIDLLDLFEKSGLSSSATPYLFAVTSVDFNVPELVQTDDESLDIDTTQPNYDVSISLTVHSFTTN